MNVAESFSEMLHERPFVLQKITTHTCYKHPLSAPFWHLVGVSFYRTFATEQQLWNLYKNYVKNIKLFRR